MIMIIDLKITYPVLQLTTFCALVECVDTQNCHLSLTRNAEVLPLPFLVQNPAGALDVNSVPMISVDPVYTLSSMREKCITLYSEQHALMDLCSLLESNHFQFVLPTAMTSISLSLSVVRIACLIFQSDAKFKTVTVFRFHQGLGTTQFSASTSSTA